MPLRGHRLPWRREVQVRRIAVFVVLVGVAALGASGARAESVEARSRLGFTPTRIRGAVTLLPVPWGHVAMGGSSLRHLPSGTREWQTLHRVAGDNLYRIDGHESGALLAAWEKEAVFHLFVPATKEHRTFPKPGRPSDAFRSYGLGGVHFTKDGSAAIVFMNGETGNIVRTTVAYHYPLDGESAPALLFQQAGHELHSTARASLFATSTNARMPCDNNGCFPLSAVIAWEIDGATVTKRTLLAGKGDEYGIARMLWGEDDDRFAIAIHGEVAGERNVRQLLRWRGGETSGTLFPFEKRAGYGRLLKSGTVVELYADGGKGLEIRRHAANGWARTMTIAPFPHSDPDVVRDNSVHALRERKNGELLVHWGNHLVLVPSKGAPRAYDLEPLLKRRNEWAGVMVYVAEPESVWVGVEIGGGRDFLQVPLAEVEKGAVAVSN